MATDTTPFVHPIQTPSDTADYDAYVATRHDATLYHLRAWKDVVERAYGMEAPFLLARDGQGGRVRGVLPLLRVGRPLAAYYTSGPFGAYGPFLVEDQAAGQALVKAACQYIDQGRAKYLYLKILGEPPAWTGLEATSPTVIAKMDLTESVDTLWKGLKSALRTEVRRAEKEGLTPRIGHGEFEGFYDVLGENMHRKGSPMYGRPFFHALLDRMGGHSTVLTLHLQGRPVAGAYVAWHEGTMYVPFASSRPEVFKLRANYLLWWEIMKFAHEQKLHTLDFGTTPRHSSNLVFKGKWNTRLEPVYAVLHTPGKARPIFSTDFNRWANLGVKLWARLPRPLMERVGPRICGWVA